MVKKPLKKITQSGSDNILQPDIFQPQKGSTKNANTMPRCKI